MMQSSLPGNSYGVAAEDEEDEFVDAQEEIVIASESGNGSPERLEEAMEDDDDEDLFAQAFGSKSSDDDARGEDDDHELEDSNAEMEDDIMTDFRDGNKTIIESEHAKGCNNIRGPSTPPDSPRRSNPNLSHLPRPPNPDKDISSNLRRLQKFHERAIELVPRLPLADHRYWIGVLNPEKEPRLCKDEKDFTWMKGNRVTTVETVWNMYHQTTATDDFVLLLGCEKVEFKDRMEELDYFNCRKIFFRAVGEKHQDAKGRQLCEFVIPKEKPGSKDVIVID